MTIYCVYLTVYRGNKLPPFYIGSTSIDKINSGYHGSVRSKKYRAIWETELRTNQNLFSTKIIKTFDTRSSALAYEADIQNKLNVVQNILYCNMAVATVNGMFGMDVKGKNNPNYGNKWQSSQRAAASERNSIYMQKNPKIWISKIIDGKVISKFIFMMEKEKYISSGWETGKRKELHTDNIRVSASITAKRANHTLCTCMTCKKVVQAHTLNHHIKTHHSSPKLEYFGKNYPSFGELLKQTGCSKHLYQKWYLNGYDPRPSIGNRNIHFIPPKLVAE